MHRRLWICLAFLAALVVVTPAHAATGLTQVGSFGSNPGALHMYSYVPTDLPSGRPVVVALHGCGQSASDYYGHSGWPKYADLYRAALVFPEQTSSNNPLSCFNWYVNGDITRGAGEALSIKQMVDYAVATYGSDPRKVYVTGLSAGGAMTAVMLATYPDVFAGGAVVAGLPYNCGTVCQYQAQTKTPSQWGDLVRAADPGFTGQRPRVAIWYGTSDTTVVPANATELRDQFTDAAGIPPTATGSVALSGGTTEDLYGTSVALFKVPGIGHGTPVDPGSSESQCGTTGTYYLASICSSYYIAQFWGLTGGSSTPPPTTTPPTTTPPTSQPCFTASNYAQVAAGRAHQSAGQTYANGSNQAMGLWNTFTVHTLRQTGANYYTLADGQC
ncbi:MAG TPA: PHB depolymerase family esterase [Actinoplanes sp.]